jgi:hypothetical protein
VLRLLQPSDQPAVDERQRAVSGRSTPQSLPSMFISTKRVAFHSLLQKLR